MVVTIKDTPNNTVYLWLKARCRSFSPWVSPRSLAKQAQHCIPLPCFALQDEDFAWPDMADACAFRDRIKLVVEDLILNRMPEPVRDGACFCCDAQPSTGCPRSVAVKGAPVAL